MNALVDTIPNRQAISLDMGKIALVKNRDHLNLRKTSHFIFVISNIKFCNLNYFHRESQPINNVGNSTVIMLKLLNQRLKLHWLKIHLYWVKFAEKLNKNLYSINLLTKQILIIFMLRFVNRGFIHRKDSKKLEVYKVRRCV